MKVNNVTGFSHRSHHPDCINLYWRVWSQFLSKLPRWVQHSSLDRGPLSKLMIFLSDKFLLPYCLENILESGPKHSLQERMTFLNLRLIEAGKGCKIYHSTLINYSIPMHIWEWNLTAANGLINISSLIKYYAGNATAGLVCWKEELSNFNDALRIFKVTFNIIPKSEMGPNKSLFR